MKSMNDYTDFDIKRIKKMTMDRVKLEKNDKRKFIKKPVSWAVSFAMIIVLGSATVLAATSPEVRAYISELFGFNPDYVLHVGESVENDDYELTLEGMVYDGIIAEMIISLSAKSEKSQATFNEYDLISWFGGIIRNATMIEMEEFTEEHTKFYKVIYTGNFTRYSFFHDGHFDEFEFTFLGMGENIVIPIETTIELSEKEINVEPVDYYARYFDAIYYSEIGFTIDGYLDEDKVNELDEGRISDMTHVNEIANLKIDIVLNDGSVIDLLEHYVEFDENNTALGEWETTVKDGVEYETFNYENKILHEHELVSYLYHGGRHNTEDDVGEEKVFGSSVTILFNEALDWSTVDKMIINNVEVDFN